VEPSDQLARRFRGSWSVHREADEAGLQPAFGHRAELPEFIGRGDDGVKLRQGVEEREHLRHGRAAGVVEFIDALHGPLREKIPVTGALAPFADEFDAEALAVHGLDGGGDLAGEFAGELVGEGGFARAGVAIEEQGQPIAFPGHGPRRAQDERGGAEKTGGELRVES
jgi:hypothetical protein